MTEQTAIEQEIEVEIRKRFFYARSDFVVNHILVFITVVASSFPAATQILNFSNEQTAAAVAAIPTFVLLLQKTFKWEQRAEWHWDYRRRVMAIRRQLRDQGLQPVEASKQMNALESDLAGTFPGVSQPASSR